MRPLHALVLSSLLLSSGVTAYVSLVGTNRISNGSVSSALAQRLEDPKVREFDYARLTEFPFSDVLVFEPYAERRDICPIVGLTGWQCLRTVPFQVEGGHYFLLFRQGGKVVHHEFQSMSLGRFIGLPSPAVFTDLTARFHVLRDYSKRDATGEVQVLFHLNRDRRSQ